MKSFKPFWSFNIKNIENCLSEKALEGYILKDVNPFLNTFIFEKGESKALNYRISYEKKGTLEIQPSLIKNGWFKVCNRGRWFFLANENKLEDIKAIPYREPLLNRYKIAEAILSLITAYFGVMTAIFLIFLVPMIISYYLGIGDIRFIKELSTNRVIDAKYSYFTMKDITDSSELIFITAFLIYPIKKLKKNEKQLKLDLNSSCLEIEKDYIEEKNIEEELIEKKGPTILEPDKLERWIEDMEDKGYNLKKVKGRKFYFSKGTPRKIRYVLDFQNDPNSSYYEICKEDQWKLVYSVGSMPVKWSLWCKEYTEERPNIYTDKEEIVSNAKKMLLTYTISYLPVIVFLSYYVIKTIILLTKDISRTIEILPYMVGIMLIMVLPLILFSYLYSKVIKYYLKVKNN